MSSVRRRSNAHQDACVFVGQYIQKAIRALTDVADALMQTIEQRFLAKLLHLVVENDSYQSSSAIDFAAAGAGYEQIVFPG